MWIGSKVICIHCRFCEIGIHLPIKPLQFPCASFFEIRLEGTFAVSMGGNDERIATFDFTVVYTVLTIGSVAYCWLPILFCCQIYENVLTPLVAPTFYMLWENNKMAYNFCKFFVKLRINFFFWQQNKFEFKFKSAKPPNQKICDVRYVNK